MSEELNRQDPVLPRVFFVESDKNIVKIQEYIFEKQAQLIVAPSISEAQRFINEQPKPTLMVVEGVMPLHEHSLLSGELTTEEFIKGVRSKYHDLTIIGMAQRQDHQKRLLAAGCDEVCESKGTIQDAIRHHLHLKDMSDTP